MILKCTVLELDWLIARLRVLYIRVELTPLHSAARRASVLLFFEHVKTSLEQNVLSPSYRINALLAEGSF